MQKTESETSCNISGQNHFVLICCCNISSQIRFVLNCCCNISGQTERPEKTCYFWEEFHVFCTFQLILVLLMHIEYHFCKTINLARTLLSWGVFNHYLPKLKTTRNYQFSWVWLLFDMIQKPHPSVDTNATGCMKAISFVSRNGKLIQRAFSMSLPCVITLLTR